MVKFPTDQDHYKTLGIAPDATIEQIKLAYRRLAKRYHPDANPDDPTTGDRFKQLAEAYRVLSDPKLRLEYHERFLAHARAGFHKMKPTAYAVWQEFSQHGEKRHRVEKRGMDIVVTIPITLEEIVTGGSRTVTINRLHICKLCGGTGVKPGLGKIICPICNGIGEIPATGSHGLRFEQCRNCHGEGQIIREHCMHCNGKGRERQNHPMVIQIPKGLPTDKPIVMKGQGHIGDSVDQPGDLRVNFIEAPHKYFTRSNRDLQYEIILSPELYYLGGDVSIPTLSTPVSLKLVAGLPDGKMLCIRSRGLPAWDGGATGDLYVVVRHRFPPRYSPTLREIMHRLTDQPEFAQYFDSSGFTHRPDFVEEITPQQEDVKPQEHKS